MLCAISNRPPTAGCSRSRKNSPPSSIPCGVSRATSRLRSAWDGSDLRSLAGLHPIQATGTHISLIAHITQRELEDNLLPTEAHNGFANRCLWTGIQRSQCLPEGGNLDAHELF